MVSSPWRICTSPPTIAGSAPESAAENHRAICCTSVSAGVWSGACSTGTSRRLIFYLSIGAQPQDEWVRYRLTGDALRAFAGVKRLASRSAPGVDLLAADQASTAPSSAACGPASARRAPAARYRSCCYGVIRKQLSGLCLTAFSCHLSAELQPLRGSSTALSTPGMLCGIARPNTGDGLLAQRAGSAVEDRANDAAGIAQGD